MNNMEPPFPADPDPIPKPTCAGHHSVMNCSIWRDLMSQSCRSARQSIKHSRCFFVADAGVWPGELLTVFNLNRNPGVTPE